MAKIIIGQEYESEFKSICALFKGGFLSDQVHIKRADGKVITTLTHTFEYREDEHGVNGGEDTGSSLGYTAQGASWFAPLRGVPFDSGNSDWKQLIMDVAADYHRNYSLIEFKQSKDARSLNDEKRLLIRFKTGFIDRVFDDGKSFTLIDKRNTEPENFYAVSMRLEISGGGESEPLLGKIYFKETGAGKLTPIKTGEAKKIDAFISSAVPSDSEGGMSGEIIDGSLVDRVFSGLEKAFSDGKFASYVSFNDKYKQEIDGMLSQLATSEVKELDCTNVKVLGVSHVEWEKSVYSLLYRGKQIMKVVVGLNGAISLFCSNCEAGGALIEDNVIRFKDGIPYGVNAVLDFTSDNLGLITDDIKAIKQSGAVSDHLFTVSCRENPRNPNCFKVVCMSQSIEVSNGVRKCKGCRYPEIVYKDIFSERADDCGYTPHLNFAMDKLSLVPESTGVCRCCGREFTRSSLSRNGWCPFCQTPDRSPKAKKLYAKYGNMLGLGVRFFHLFSKKYCREEGNIILFEIGNDRYVFDKLNATESGYIKKPKKVRRNGGR